MVAIQVFGIWSKEKNKMIYVNLEQEDIETEFEMEGYDDDKYAIVCMDAMYDVSALRGNG